MQLGSTEIKFEGGQGTGTMYSCRALVHVTGDVVGPREAHPGGGPDDVVGEMLDAREAAIQAREDEFARMLEIDMTGYQRPSLGRVERVMRGSRRARTPTVPNWRGTLHCLQAL